MNPLMPNADEFGFIKTLNNQGFMTNYLDKFSEEFTKFAPKAPGPSLDIGAAYGVAVIEALKNGASVIANDSDSRHLDILQETATEVIGHSAQSRLQLAPGIFPNELAFRDGELGAVLACRVFHFFDGPTIEQGVALIYRWLAKGGKFFLVSETPYVGGVKNFIPTYEDRIRQGARWPGFIEDFQSLDPIRGKDLPKQMHLLDESVLRRTFEAAGFEVIKASKFARPNFPPNLKLDGRESVGIIGIKK